MAVVSMKALLEAGVHFGHRTRRWNPKMKTYIFTERNSIHIIDLQQTLAQLDRAYTFVQDTVARRGTILFVGTKKQAQETISQEAERCQMPYVNQRWLGGTLTNWITIRQRIDQLIELETRQERGEFNRLTKKEALEKQRLIAKLQRRLGGLRIMTDLPDIVMVTDIHREDLAVAEANKLHIPIIAMVDTNCDPTPIDLVIPANDDAIRAIKLIVGKMADAVIEGEQLRVTLEAEAEQEEVEDDAREGRDEGDEDVEDDRYLAPALLARLRSGEFGDTSSVDVGKKEEDVGASAVEEDEEERVTLNDDEIPPADDDLDEQDLQPEVE